MPNKYLSPSVELRAYASARGVVVLDQRGVTSKTLYDAKSIVDDFVRLSASHSGVIDGVVSPETGVALLLMKLS